MIILKGEKYLLTIPGFVNSQWEDVSSLWLDSALVHVRCLSRKFVTSMLTEEYMARPERNLQNHRDLVNTKRKLFVAAKV